MVHAVLLVIFFSLAGRGLAKAFKLPSSSKLLVILAVVAAVIGIVMATRQGRNFAARKLLPADCGPRSPAWAGWPGARSSSRCCSAARPW